jgi:hypothetical protein
MFKFDNAKNLLRFGFLTACSISTSQWPESMRINKSGLWQQRLITFFYEKIVCTLTAVFDEWMIFAT